MSDLTERAREVVRVALVGPRHDGMNRLIAGRLAVEALAKAGMLTDPDPRITAASAHAAELRRVLAHVFAEAGMLTDYDGGERGE